MNDICEKINTVFNKDIASCVSKSIKIYEADEGATLKEFEILNENSIVIDNEILDHCNRVFKDNNSKLSLNTGCDGIILTKIKDEWCLVVIELKSSFTTNAIRKAKNQLQSTYPKVAMILSMVDVSIPIKNLKVVGFIISKKPTAEKKSNILKRASIDIKPCIEKVCRKFITKGEYLFDKGDYLGFLPLRDDYCFDEMIVHYIDSDKLSFNLSSYL